MAKFNVGDLVKVIGKDRDYTGCTGTITEDDKSHRPYRVKHVDGFHRWYNDSELKLVKGSATTELKLHDKVKFAADYEAQRIRREYHETSTQDTIFTITSVNKYGNIEVDGRGRWYKAERFVKATTQTGLMGVPAANPAKEFKAGEYVRLNYGSKGIVVLTEKNPASSKGWYWKKSDEKQSKFNWDNEESFTKLPETKTTDLKVGDFVAVITDKYTKTQLGDRGYIYEIGEYSSMNVKVRFEGEGSVRKQSGTVNSYSAKDLVVLPTPIKKEVNPVYPKYKLSDRPYFNGEKIYVCGAHKTLVDSYYYQPLGQGTVRQETKVVHARNLSMELPVPTVAPKSEGTFIVVNRKADGKLDAATRPYVHLTRKQAEAEALRLANLGTTNGEFVVFEALAAAAVPSRPQAALRAL